MLSENTEEILRNPHNTITTNDNVKIASLKQPVDHEINQNTLPRTSIVS